LPSKTIAHDTPLHKLFGTHPNYNSLKVFGWACWPNLHPYNPKKLDFRTKQCIFLGYSSSHKGYKYFDHTTGRIYISRDVVFDEQNFPFVKSPSNSVKNTQNSHHPVILPILAKTNQYTENSLIQSLSEPVDENANMEGLQTNPDANVQVDSSPVTGLNSIEDVERKQSSHSNQHISID
jgi:hypothetical protein